MFSMKHFLYFTICLPLIFFVLLFISRAITPDRDETSSQNDVIPVYIGISEMSQPEGVFPRYFKGPCGEYCISYDGKSYSISGECAEKYHSVEYVEDKNAFFLK